MAKLIYFAIASLDGYVADSDGNFDWAEPDEEMHSFVNDRGRLVGTYLYGRRMYEVMLAWETFVLEGQPQYIRDYAGIWRSAEKIVYSGTLGAASSERTRIERTFDPQAVRRLKESKDRDMAIGGPGLAAEAFRAGLIDECHILVAPISVGGGNKALPDDIRITLELTEERRFAHGAVYLRYQVAR